jgi:transposase
MHYATSIGLDVHLSTISACAFVPDTGEFDTRTFAGDDTAGIARWAKSFSGPVQAIYESGFCGFTLQRELRRQGVDCRVAAISKLARPSGDKVKTDRRDARFLAIQLACGNVTTVNVPTVEREGMRDISRALGIATDGLTAVRLRVVQTHHRCGLRFPGKERPWTQTWMSWAKKAALPTEAAQLAYDHHLTHALYPIDEKARLERQVEAWCKDDSVRDMIRALCRIKGISKTIAFALATEIDDFTRFKTAAGFASFLGPVPSESSSGKTRRQGGITRTGNEHVRRHLIEASRVYSRIKSPHKKAADGISCEVKAIAARANRRLMDKRGALAGKKHPCVANAATARELATWIWQPAKVQEATSGKVA